MTRRCLIRLVRFAFAAIAAIAALPATSRAASSCAHYVTRQALANNACSGAIVNKQQYYIPVTGGSMPTLTANVGSLSASVSNTASATDSTINVTATHTNNQSSLCNEPPYYSGTASYSTFEGSGELAAATTLRLDVSATQVDKGSLVVEVRGNMPGGQFRRAFNNQAVTPQNYVIPIGAGQFSYTIRYSVVPPVEGSFTGNLSASLRGFSCLPSPPTLRVLEPASSDRLEPNQPVDITWVASADVATVSIEFEADPDVAIPVSEQIASGVPAAQQSFSWTPPDTVCRPCVVRVIADNVAGLQSETSFDVHTFWLRKQGDEDYPTGFEPGDDGWMFPNARDVMWPAEWWAQFDYPNPATKDPNTNQPYPPTFHGIARDRFPDWPLFVETFGLDACYEHVGNAVYRPSAIARWRSIASRWIGSCGGFALSSIQAFFDPDAMASFYSVTTPFDFLSELGPNDDHRLTVNHAHLMPNGWQFYDQVQAEGLTALTPVETLNRVAFMLEYPDPALPMLYVKGPGGGVHLVVPWRVQLDADGPGVHRIRVYDPNAPGDRGRFVVVDTNVGSGGQWEYPAAPDTGYFGTSGLYVGLPYATFFTLPRLEQSVQAPAPELASRATGAEAAAAIGIELRTPGATHVEIVGTGGSLVADARSFTSNLPGLEVIPDISGSPGPPAEFLLPSGPYVVRVAAGVDSQATVAVFANDRMFVLERDGVVPGTLVEARWTGSLEWTAGGGRSNVNVVIPGAIERAYDVGVAGDPGALQVTRDAKGDLVVDNPGDARTVELAATIADPIGPVDVVIGALELAANSRHRVFAGAPTRVYVDHGRDGSVEDSLSFGPVASVPDGGSGEDAAFTPWVRPNPARGASNIGFSLGRDAHVRAVVHDVRGAEVARLADGRFAAGAVRLAWDGGTAAPGLYFVRLEVRDDRGTRTETLRLARLR